MSEQLTPEQKAAAEKAAAEKTKQEAADKAKAEEAAAKAKLEEEKQKRKDAAEDPLYAETDQRLKGKLGDEVYKDFKDKPLKERVLLLLAIEKAVDKAATKQAPPPIDKTADPNGITAPPAGSAPEEPKTLAELNRRDEFNRDYAQANSIIGRSNRMRTRDNIQSAPNPAVGHPSRGTKTKK